MFFRHTHKITKMVSIKEEQREEKDNQKKGTGREASGRRKSKTPSRRRQEKGVGVFVIWSVHEPQIRRKNQERRLRFSGNRVDAGNAQRASGEMPEHEEGLRRGQSRRPIYVLECGWRTKIGGQPGNTIEGGRKELGNSGEKKNAKAEMFFVRGRSSKTKNNQGTKPRRSTVSVGGKVKTETSPPEVLICFSRTPKKQGVRVD